MKAKIILISLFAALTAAAAIGADDRQMSVKRDYPLEQSSGLSKRDEPLEKPALLKRGDHKHMEEDLLQRSEFPRSRAPSPEARYTPKTH
ncbi:hypothetical protein B0T14DRAFT_568501 [Immersiella caudata]|uniref:Uncharacterized protein n=1 Tax=Immersiella caudata TaxID=314043 RepID=A0AA39WKE9_9PEZI|nr:hypothetical protein B0T14DRAFT_568501 [Immersiella caudata]